MDSTWQAAQNWLLFAGVAGGLGYYYWSQNKTAQTTATTNRRRSVQEPLPKAKRRALPEQTKPDSKVAPKAAPKASNEGTKKRKGQTQQQPQAQLTPTVVVQDEQAGEEEIDMSTRQFAEQMSKARKGNDLSAPKGSNQKPRTVKTGNAVTAPELSSASSQAGADADDDLTPAGSPAMHAGDVSDMLEPATKGPSTLRLTGSAKPQKERVAKQSKADDVETKKQRQNRAKKDQQRLEREAEEKERKGHEEKQRRAAREARGEPSKNGMVASKPPTSSIWTAPKSAQPTSENAAPAVNGSSSAPLLDTFDVESSASSNGGKTPSTAATSTTDAEYAKRDHDSLSEEDQMAMAVKQSEDESGWTTVAMPKKQQKKKPSADEDGTGSSTPVEAKPAPKAAPAVRKPAVNGKPNGFQALEDQYEQRADVDSNDPENWDA
ncbi:hypothetical protein LTR08_008347 [Meristemomyces frigidus]|nr:hypothetical protein LTR08_008347 [Meristemomyces frigidus]